MVGHFVKYKYFSIMIWQKQIPQNVMIDIVIKAVQIAATYEIAFGPNAIS